MKYLLLLLSLAASICTATATTPPTKDTCCKGKQCCTLGCCKK